MNVMRSRLEESKANSRRVSGSGYASNANNSGSYDFGSMPKYEYVKPKKYLDSHASTPITRLEVLAWLEEST